MKRTRTDLVFSFLPGFRNQDGFHARELIRGTTVAIIVKLLGTASAFAFNIVIARYLGAAGTGLFLLALTATTIASILGRLGLDNAVLRLAALQFAANNPAGVLRVYRGALAIVFPVASITMLLVASGSHWIANTLFKDPQIAEPILWLSAGILPLSVLMLQGEILRGAKRIIESLSLQVVCIPVFSFIAAISIGSQIIVNTVATIYLGSVLLTVLIGHLMIQRVTSIQHQPRGKLPIVELLSSCRYLFTADIMSQIVMPWSPILFLGILESSAEVGIFGMANRTAAVTSLILVAANSIAAPKFASLYKQGHYEELSRIAGYATTLMMFAALPVLFIFIFASSWVMGLYGEEFKVGAVLLLIMTVGQFINVATGPVNYLLTMSGNERDFRNNTLIAALINLILCVVLIPKFGAIGAAVAAACSLASINLFAAYLVRRRLGFILLPFLGAQIRGA